MHGIREQLLLAVLTVWRRVVKSGRGRTSNMHSIVASAVLITTPK